MPIYEVHCQKCDQDSEILVANSQWQGTPCPKCGAKKLSKNFSMFAASVTNVRPLSECRVKHSACCGCANHHH